MTSDSIISSDHRSGRVAGVKKPGFYYNWGPQAWIDMWMSDSMLVKKAMPLISHTFVPILRLSGEKEQVDRDYTEIKSRRESIKWSDSPREKWRKRYGNFVREMEWALLELRKYYSQKQYEEIGPTGYARCYCVVMCRCDACWCAIALPCATMAQLAAYASCSKTT